MARILVVDDEPDIREVCALALREAGHQVVLADNGASALHIHRLKPQDVVVLDLFMPVMDGVETAKRLRACERPPKIVAVSAGWRVTSRRREDDGSDALHEAEAVGADIMLPKPFDPDDLVRAVNELLR